MAAAKTFTVARSTTLEQAFSQAHQWFEGPVHMDAVTVSGQHAHWTFSAATR